MTDAVTPWERVGDLVLEVLRSALVPAPGRTASRQRALGELLADGLFAALHETTDLGPGELELLALLVAVEASADRQRLLAVAQGDPSATRPTLSTLVRLHHLAGTPVLAVAEGGRLRRCALIDVEQEGSWGSRTVSPAAPVVWALLGDPSLDPDLPEGAVVLPPTSATTTLQEQPVLHLLAGADRTSRRLRAGEALGGEGLLVTPAPAGRREWDAVVREATLGGLGVLVESDDVPPGLGGAMRRADHVRWGLSSSHEVALADLPDLPRRDVPVGDGTAGPEDWAAMVGADPPAGARLDRRQLEMTALSASPPEEAVRRLSSGPLDRLATRVRPRRGWPDLVLPESIERQARGLVARHQHRQLVYDTWGFPGLPSRGTVALLSGPSGTGKTLTAEVVAGELGQDLFVLDLSRMMSKYIGETEKNLDELFDAAALSDAVLFFDEADALLGKRSPVTDAKDRYANVGVSYLLQRLERHDGLVLLATNLPSNIDDAFLRRLHASLEYVLPSAPERRRIWARSFPPGCPTRALDLDVLAEHVELAGGPICAAALAAAFAAAAADEPVTMALVAAAVVAEYRKQGRLAAPEAVLRLASPSSPTSPASRAARLLTSAAPSTEQRVSPA